MTRPHSEPDRDGDQIAMIRAAAKFFLGTVFACIVLWAGIVTAHAAVQPPMSWRFCWDNRADCTSSPATTIPTDQRDHVADINGDVNWRIRPLFGADLYASALGPWRVIEADGDSGVCKDYAVTKLHDLRAAGFPVGAMSLLYVHIDRADARLNHLVLVVRFDDGDYVLDNLTNVMWRVEERDDYRMISRTAWGNPNVWVSEGLGDAR